MLTAMAGGWVMFGMGAVCLLAVLVLLLAAAGLIKYLRCPGGQPWLFMEQRCF
ncbi:hypothetical protein [Limimaricola cinnabarinus]|uniref:hypothetical protein n=1 Tax=Limimaricola cinnabarinus TaxID=1125964 RepID=UPI002FE3766F